MFYVLASLYGQIPDKRTIGTLPFKPRALSHFPNRVGMMLFYPNIPPLLFVINKYTCFQDGGEVSAPDVLMCRRQTEELTGVMLNKRKLAVGFMTERIWGLYIKIHP